MQPQQLCGRGATLGRVVSHHLAGGNAGAPADEDFAVGLGLFGRALDAET